MLDVADAQLEYSKNRVSDLANVKPRQLHPLVEAQASQTAARGLMAYPTLSPADRVRIEGIDAFLSCAVGPVQVRLPKSDLTVCFDPRLPAELLYFMVLGDYEQSDLDIATHYVAQGEKVMELGAGIGITGCALARASGLAVVAVEPNPVLWEHIERNYRTNGQEVELVRGAAVPSNHQSLTVPFHLAPNYWWSSLMAVEGGQRIEVHALKLSELLRAHRPQVLVIDIEGAEASLVGEALPGVDKVFIEIHTPSLGTRATGSVVAWLEQEGFRLVDLRAQTWVFRRDH